MGLNGSNNWIKILDRLLIGLIIIIIVGLIWASFYDRTATMVALIPISILFGAYVIGSIVIYLNNLILRKIHEHRTENRSCCGEGEKTTSSD